MRGLAAVEALITRERALILACLIVPMLLVLECATIWSDPSVRLRFPFGHDLSAFWAAARLASEGRIPALYDPVVFGAMQEGVSVREGYLGWFYPPTWLQAVRPLGALSFPAAWAVFSLLSLGALAMAARSFLAGRDRAGWFLLFGAPVIAITLVQGQNGALVAALLVGGLAARAAGRHWIAATLLAALALKPHLALLVPLALAAAGDWKGIGRTLLLVSVFLLMTGLSLGWESWRLFFLHLGDARAALSDRAVLAQMPTAYASALLAGTPRAVAAMSQALSAAIAAAFVWWLWRARTVPPDLQLAGLLMAALLVPPYGFRYDMVLTLAATLLIVGRAERHGWLPGEKLAMAALWLLPMIVPNIAHATGLPAGFALLLLGLWSVRRRAVLHGRTPPPAAQRSPAA